MSKASTHSIGFSGPRTARIADKYSIVSLSAMVFALIVSPLVLFFDPPAHSLQGIMEGRWENRIFWPATFVVSLALAARNYSRLTRLAWSPHIICLLAYLAFAGASVLWAFKPDLSFIRYVQQLMIVTSIVVPAMLAAQTTDMMRGLFLCFATAAILNLFFLLGGSPPTVVDGEIIGYPGYFPFKNYLGECAAPTLLLAMHEMLYPGFRRFSGAVIAVIAVILVFWANSKTALGLALLAPVLAGAALFTRKLTRVSLAVLLWTIPICFIAIPHLFHYSLTGRIAYALTGDSTFTGREFMWFFADAEIDRRPLLGWGYLSFWLAGPDAPSIVDASGWIKTMPNAHNGYYDTMLEMGYLGLALLLAFITATLHAIGRIAVREPRRAWLILSLALFIILYNFLESIWMQGFEFLWVMFLILAAEIGLRLRPVPVTGTAHRSRAPRQGAPAPPLIGLRPGPRIPT